MKRARDHVERRLARLVGVPEDEGSPVHHAPKVPIREIVAQFWPYARPFRFWLGLSFVLIILVPAITAAQIWMYKLVIDEVLVPEDFGPFLWIAGAYIALTIVGGLVSFADDYLSVWIGERFLLELRTSVFRHVQGLSLGFFERRRLGDIVARLTGDVSAIETFVLSGVTRALAYAAQIVVFAGFLVYLQWELALVALLVVPLVWVAARYFARLVKQASREKRRRSGALSAVAEESLANAQLVQAYDRQETEVERFRRQNIAAYEAELAATRVKALFSPVLDMMKVTVVLIILGLGAWELQQGRITLGGLIVFLTYLAMLYSPIKGASRLTNSLYAATAAAERIIEVLDEQPSVVDQPPAEPIGRWARPRHGLRRTEGQIAFRNVSFAYGQGLRDARLPTCRSLWNRVRPSRSSGVAVPGSRPSQSSSCASTTPPGDPSSSTEWTFATCAWRHSGRKSRSCFRRHWSLTARFATTSRTASRARPMRTSCALRCRQTQTTSSLGFRAGTTHSLANADEASREASASASRSRGR
jgi:ABC-type multidrug transport system fused ATPase/permease subunit